MTTQPTDEGLPGGGAPATPPMPPPPAPATAQPKHPALAGVDKRLLAYLIDFGLVFGTLIAIFIVALIASAIFGDGVIGTIISLMFLLLYVAWFAAAIAYPLYTMSRTGQYNGQTLGKQWIGIRVVREDGLPCDLGTATMRAIVGSALPNIACGIYFFVDSPWCIWDPRSQCLHDKIAKTLVFDATVDPVVALQVQG